MALLTNTFETGADGDTITIANSASPDRIYAEAITTAATVQFSTAQAQKGTKSLRFIYNNTAGTAGIQFNQATATAANAIRFYFRFASLPSISGLCLFTLHAASLTDRRFYVTVDNVGNFQSYDFGGAVNFASGNGAVAVNTWYRLELGITAVTGSAGSSDLRVYLGDSLTSIPALTSSLTSQNYGGSTLANIQIGRFNAASPAANGTPTLFYDDFAWNSGSAALLGPSVIPPSTQITHGTHIHIG